MVVDVVSEAGVAWSDLDGLGVTRGPGTFTGVRVGLAAARGIALVRGLAVAGVTSLHAIAAGARRAREAGPAEAIMTVIDARRGQAYVQSFAPSGFALGPPELRAMAAVGEGAPRVPLVLIGSGAEAAAVHMGPAGLRVVPSRRNPDAADVALLAAEAMAAESWMDPGPPRPLYLRAPDARLPAPPQFGDAGPPRRP